MKRTQIDNITITSSSPVPLMELTEIPAGQHRLNLVLAVEWKTCEAGQGFLGFEIAGGAVVGNSWLDGLMLTRGGGYTHYTGLPFDQFLPSPSPVGSRQFEVQLIQASGLIEFTSGGVLRVVTHWPGLQLDGPDNDEVKITLGALDLAAL